MKSCHNCQHLRKSILHPYCTAYEQYVRHDADRNLIPVHKCCQTEEQKAALKRNPATAGMLDAYEQTDLHSHLFEMRS